jgi:hypothetical protein
MARVLDVVRADDVWKRNEWWAGVSPYKFHQSRFCVLGQDQAFRAREVHIFKR